MSKIVNLEKKSNRKILFWFIVTKYKCSSIIVNCVYRKMKLDARLYERKIERLEKKTITSKIAKSL